jgi:hypothetical protein
VEGGREGGAEPGSSRGWGVVGGNEARLTVAPVATPKTNTAASTAPPNAAQASHGAVGSSRVVLHGGPASPRGPASS